MVDVSRREERKLSILKFVKENPGTSLTRILHNLKHMGAKVTLIADIRQMVENGCLEVIKGERRGQKDKYFITERGMNALIKLPKALKSQKGLIKIAFSEDFLKHFEDDETVTKFLNLMDKEEGRKLIDLIGSQIAFYLKNVRKPLYSIEYIEELKRFFFVGSLPEEVSNLMLKAVQYGTFSSPIEAFDFILVKMGIQGFIGALKGGLSKEPNKITFTLTPISYTPKYGYVLDYSKAKEYLEKIPSEQLKDMLLRGLSIWERL